jgi:hypothetical protein
MLVIGPIEIKTKIKTRLFGQLSFFKMLQHLRRKVDEKSKIGVCALSRIESGGRCVTVSSQSNKTVTFAFHY